MFGLGMSELLVIMVIVTIVFGASRLPELGGAVGKCIRNFQKSVAGKDDIELQRESNNGSNKA